MNNQSVAAVITRLQANQEVHSNVIWTTIGFLMATKEKHKDSGAFEKVDAVQKAIDYLKTKVTKA